MDEKVVVDIGGMCYYTTHDTISKSPYFKRIMPAGSQYVFVDRDGLFFPYVLNFLRTGQLIFTYEDDKTVSIVRNEAMFYEINDMSKQIDSHECVECPVLHEMKRTNVLLSALLQKSS